uniref:TIL domain-containing protein n=1 Tax=Anopheles christyi TaxID=43041 RepID=A0A182KAG5_9DIPT
MKLHTSLPAIFLLFVSLLTVILAQVTDPNEQIVCNDPNEVYDDCGPACGDRSCTNMRKNDSICQRSCNPGCFCRGGYVRNKAMRCVPSYLCQSMG